MIHAILTAAALLLQDDGALRAYLEREFPAVIDAVSVDASKIVVSGKLKPGTKGPFLLAEFRPWEDVAGRLRAPRTHALPKFILRCAAEVERFDGPYDRLYSRWALVRSDAGGEEPVSRAVWATEVAAQWPDLVAERPASKKGMAGVAWDPARMDDLVSLGVKSITVNVFLESYVRTKAAADTMADVQRGRPWHFHRPAVERLDQLLRWAARNGIVVSAILLVPRTSKDAELQAALAHPDAVEPGVYSMPNVRSEEGVERFAAAVRFLASRYTRPDKANGRITHWIVGNEVDSGWTWTNAGVKSATAYMEDYLRALRIVHYAVRSFDPNGKAFISLTHCWNEAHQPKDARYYRGRELLEILEARSRVEGDFEWGVAHHPYPQDLFNPRTWEDARVSFDFDTPRITFKNIEVLDAWMKRDAAKFRGKVRTVLLSEQGFHSRDGEEGEILQAAALAYAWNRLRGLDSIEAFHYHRWVDHEREGGLRLGLWTVQPGTVFQPDRPKRAHAVFAALGGDQEAEATSFALPILGAKTWDEVRRQKP